MSLAVDASVVVAALTGIGSDGRWAQSLLAGEELVAPHLMPAEVASMLRRATAAGTISPNTAALAHADLLGLRASLLPYEPFASRIWELRANVTPYDAWYIALAESLDISLATVDGRLTRATGTRCVFVTPPPR